MYVSKFLHISFIVYSFILENSVDLNAMLSSFAHRLGL